MSGSDGEGLETGGLYRFVPRQSLTRQTAFDELKTHLKGRQIALRSKTPALVRQEFYGFVLTYFAIRQVIHEAALDTGRDPDRLSFINAVRVLQRKAPLSGAIPP